MFLKRVMDTILAISLLASCLLTCTSCGNDNNIDNNSSTTSSTDSNANSSGESIIVEDSIYGVTAEFADNSQDYTELSVYTMKRSGDLVEFTDEVIRDIYNIEVVLSQGQSTYYESEISSTAKISIPYTEEGLYIIGVKDSNCYNVESEYTDGKYVFETDTLGQFILSSTPVSDIDYTNESNLNLVEQTIVDEYTGITVSGMLPEGANMFVYFYIIDFEILFEEFDAPHYYLSNDYPQYSLSDLLTKTDNKRITHFSNPGWMSEETQSVILENMPYMQILFFKDYQIIDFKSDLTVTVPINYRKFTEINKSDSNIMALQLDYEQDKLLSLDVLSTEEQVVFKTDSSGTFFIGNESFTETFLKHYNQTLDDIEKK